jgi:hypothetical protein
MVAAQAARAQSRISDSCFPALSAPVFYRFLGPSLDSIISRVRVQP